MSSKIGVILSMIFVALFFFLSVDVICLQFSYSDLDSKGITICYYISKECRVDTEFINYLNNKYNVSITNLSQTSIIYGDVVEFDISKKYTPLIMSNKDFNLVIKRSAVIGYYG